MTQCDPARLSADECLRRIDQLEQAKARIEARQAQYLARLSAAPDPVPGPPSHESAHLAEMSMTCEVAGVLRVSYEAACSRLHDAWRLVHALPATLNALAAGAISYRHVLRLISATKDLDDAVRAKVEAKVLPRAGEQTVAQFAAAVRRAVLAVDPRTQEQQVRAAAAERRVSYQPGSDDMAWFNAYLPAADAQVVRTAIQAVADELRRSDHVDHADCRTVDQYRADALATICAGVLDGQLSDRLGGGLPTWQGRAPHITVTVALSTLLGLDEQPGELAGYGPLSADTARRLAGDPTGTWYRLVHDELGHPIDYGRTRYRPAQDLIDFVTVRDRTCRAPRCTRPAERCDIDHVHPWGDGGRTNAENLAAQCRRHHRLKHDGGWHLKPLPEQGYEWTSPTGRVYIVRPEHIPRDTTLGDDPPF